MIPTPRCFSFGGRAQWPGFDGFVLLYFNSPLNVASAQNASNYTIVGPRNHRIKVKRAVYDAATETVTPVPAAQSSIKTKYRLTVNGTGPSGVMSQSGTGAGSILERLRRDLTGSWPVRLANRSTVREHFVKRGLVVH